MSHTAHVAIRSCKACRKRIPKNELQRWVLDANNIPLLDNKGKLGGRGAYVCSEDCYNNIHKNLAKMLVRRPSR